MAKSQSKFYGFLALILVVGAALIGYVVVSNRGEANTGEVDAVALQNLISSGSGEQLAVVRGSDDAPVTVEEFADYQCGFCGMVATLSVPQVLENYVDTGKARFVFYDFVLNPGSPAETAAQAHKVLMGRQREWGTSRNPIRMIREYADGLGLDGGALEACVENGTYRGVVMASTQHAQQRGLSSTPWFFINGRPFEGAMGYDQIARIIEEELVRSQGQ
jgi:protein-disulfide isomerase